MANHSRERLQGFTDRSDPDWKQNLLERLGQSAATKGRSAQHRRSWSTQVFADTEFGLMVKEAARGRGLSISSYIRRAIGAKVAEDLGLEFSQVMSHCARAVPFDSTGPGWNNRQRTYDDGAGHGRW